MKSADIVTRLATILPKYTAAFSKSIVIDSIIPTGSVATVTSTAHGVEDGQLVTILNAETPVQIDTSSFLRTGLFATFKTLQDHDFTLSQRDIANGGKTLTIQDANEAEFNGVFSIVRVVSRRELIISVADSGSTTISGVPLVDNANVYLFNGLVTAFNITTNTFDYNLAIPYTLAATGNPTAQTEHRISAALDFDQYLRDAYTKQLIGDDSLVVSLGDVIRSKNKNEVSDATDSSVGGYSYTPKLVQQFAVYIIQNVTSDLSGAIARDKTEGEIVPALFRALERYGFDSGFAFSTQKCAFESHGVYAFDDTDLGKAVYVHEVVFTMVADIEKVADTAEREADVAMRDVSYTMDTDKGTGVLLANVDLDDEPIE